MSGPAIAYTYSYQQASQLDKLPAGPRLRLATCDGAEQHPYFFTGRIVQPRRTADMLSALMDVVKARYSIPAAMLAKILAQADPVVTCNDDRLRFEAFSGCASSYARIDFDPESIETESFGRGTTNVDFQAPMIAALASIRDQDRVSLAVGSTAVELRREAGDVVEKKVSLPLRWLKGFMEVQAYQPRLQPVHELPGSEALRFLRSLPRMKTSRHEIWIVPAGRGLRLSQVATKDGVRVNGVERLRVLERIALHAKTLRVHGDPQTGCSGWELDLGNMRFHLVLSPDVWRGFSGEGQVLSQLAEKNSAAALAKVRAALAWQAKLVAAALAQKAKLPESQIASALALLAARGLVGYDITSQSYFHRELPFDLSLVDKLQPRLIAAKKLLAANGVQATSEAHEFFVTGSGVEHRVRWSADAPRCSCPWYAKHQGARGPCKHVLAVQMFLEEQ
jgi:hypothetical protein